MRVPRTRSLLAAVVLTTVGCSGPVVTGGEDTRQTDAPVAPTSSTRPSNDKLVNAFDFYANTDGRAGYYFTSPSGSWRCVIVPHAWAGCQSTGGGIGVIGAPQSVTDDQGQTATPNAIVVRSLGDPQFASVPADRFKPTPGPANTLPFNKILAAAGFRCNVRDAGISCLSEETDRGFTFSSAGVSWQYTDVP